MLPSGSVVKHKIRKFIGLPTAAAATHTDCAVNGENIIQIYMTSALAGVIAELTLQRLSAVHIGQNACSL